MELVRVLASVGDEVNVACFHPSPGAGLVYGTKVSSKSDQLQSGMKICSADMLMMNNRKGSLGFFNTMVQAWA